MFRTFLRTRSSSASNSSEFTLFKPLIVIAMAFSFFELLPLDFQHAIAPSIVSYEEVYLGMQTNDILAEEYEPEVSDRTNWY